MIKYFDNTNADIDPKKAAEVRKECKEAYHSGNTHASKLKMASVYGEMVKGGNLHDSDKRKSFY